MKYLLKAEEGEQVKNSIPWDLIFYNDETFEITRITEFEYLNDANGNKNEMESKLK